jgi:hypothetical protein
VRRLIFAIATVFFLSGVACSSEINVSARFENRGESKWFKKLPDARPYLVISGEFLTPLSPSSKVKIGGGLEFAGIASVQDQYLQALITPYLAVEVNPIGDLFLKFAGLLDIEVRYELPFGLIPSVSLKPIRLGSPEPRMISSIGLGYKFPFGLSSNITLSSLSMETY